MDSSETLTTKNGQLRDNDNKEWTAQRHGQQRMDSSETLTTKNGQLRDTDNKE